jgi:hypothetical protein
MRSHTNSSNNTALRRRRGEHRLPPLELHPGAGPGLRLRPAGGRERPGHRLAGRSTPSRSRPTRSTRPPGGPCARTTGPVALRRGASPNGSRTTPPTWTGKREPPGRSALSSSRGRAGLHAGSRSGTPPTTHLPAFDVMVPPLVAGWDELEPPAGSAELVDATAEAVELLRCVGLRRWDVGSVPTAVAVFWGTELLSRVQARAPRPRCDVYEYATRKHDPGNAWTPFGRAWTGSRRTSATGGPRGARSTGSSG